MPARAARIAAGLALGTKAGRPERIPAHKLPEMFHFGVRYAYREPSVGDVPGIARYWPAGLWISSIL